MTSSRDGTLAADRRWWNLATAILALLFLYLFVVNASVVDEAYITFRTSIIF